MTQFHLSTLGQCLVSLARQAIKEPLYRVRRFIESGAIVSNLKKTSNNNTNDGKLEQLPISYPRSRAITTDQVKVSFQKSAAILDQINQIQQSPGTTELENEMPSKSIIYQPNYLIEEQYQQLQFIQNQKSNIESYLNSQISTLQAHLDQIQSYFINGDYLNHVTNEVEFLQITKKLCQFSFSEFKEQNQFDDFFRLQSYIFMHVSHLNDPLKIQQIMMKFDIYYFDFDKCLQLNNGDVSCYLDYLEKIFSPPNAHFKIDQMD